MQFIPLILCGEFDFLIVRSIPIVAN